MPKQRTDRLNSLLKEVLSEVIRRDLKHNTRVSELITITRVDVSRDVRNAKVYFSVIGTDAEKASTLAALQEAAGFIAFTCSKKVVLRYFPALHFVLDEGVSKQMRIEEMLHEISDERTHREEDDSPSA